MTNNETNLIDFEGGQLLGIKDKNGFVWLGVKKACMDIGLTEDQSRRQIKNVQEDLVLKSNCAKFDTVQTEGNRQIVREVVVINEDVVSLWLAKISLTPKMQKDNPVAVDRLVKYQLKAAKVLHNAFFATEEQKQELFDELGLNGKIVNLEGKIDTLSNKITELIDNSTINSRQAQRILFAGKDRVNILLGGAHSQEYKKSARTYFKNMWLNLADAFKISTYKDLNPTDIPNAYNFLKEWSYGN